MKLTILATTLLAATRCLVAPVGPYHHGEAAKLPHPPPCGRKFGEMWTPSHRNQDGSCPTENRDAGSSADVGLSSRTSDGQPPCGSFIGEMWVPWARDSDGSCATENTHHGDSAQPGTSNKISHSPAPPCGRFIGEMWVPMKRRQDGICPAGSEIKGSPTDKEVATKASTMLARNDAGVDEWRDSMPGPVIFDGPGGTIPADEDEDEAVKETLGKARRSVDIQVL